MAESFRARSLLSLMFMKPPTSHIHALCIVIGLGLAPAGGLGCLSSTDDSKPPPDSCTSDNTVLTASLSAQADDTTVRFYAAIFNASKGSLVLGCGDTFAVTEPQSIPLEREPDPKTVIHYIATIPATPEEKTFTFALQRTAPKTTVGASKVYLPAAFKVLDATPTVKIPDAPIKFRLDPPMAVDATELKPNTVRLRIEVEGPCLEGVQKYLWTPKSFFPPLVLADGNVTLDTKLFKKKAGQTSCDAKLRVSEVTAGQIDPAFAGGVSGSFDAQGNRNAPELNIHID